MSVCEEKVESRNTYFDNAKLLLIFFVVLGHILECFAYEHIIYNSLYAIIYSFHMPLFIFISGYFSKNLKKSRDNAFSYLIPYIIFNTIWSGLQDRSIVVSIFHPIYLHWYLLSLCLWKFITKDFVKIRFYIIISILLGLYCGLFDDINRFLSVSRTIVFFPYFLLGYWCNSELIEKIKKIPKFISLFVLIVTSILVAYIFNNNIIPQSILWGADSYGSLGLSCSRGIIYRLIQYIVSIIMCITILNLIPQNSIKFSYYGYRTMTIYLGHGYIIFIISKIMPISKINPYIGTMLFIIITLMSIWVLGSNIVFDIYNKLVKNFKKIIIK